MSFPAYEEYKDSGVEWLGEVPAYWELKPLWTFYRRTKRTGFEGEELLSVYRDYGVIPKSSRDDNFNKPSEDLSPYQLVEPSDLVINKMKAWQGSVAVSDHRGIVSPAYHVFQCLHDEDSRYVHYLMRSLRYITGYLVASKGIRVNQWDLDPQQHRRMPLLVPPLPEQTAIASFLDTETSKIDSLISEQRRLIELLKEKRQAVISHAVTKGLDPSVPMKESGIEWLGEVPEHWSVQRVKTVSSFVTSGPRGWSERIADDGSLFIQSGDLNDDLGIEFSESKRVQVDDDAETIRTQLFDGDVVVCVTGAKTGKVAVCTNVPEIAYVNQHLCLVRPNDNMLPRFLGILLKSEIGLTYFDFSQYGLKQGLSLEDVKNAPVFVPPRDEQAEIVQYLEEQLGTFSQLEAQAERAIELLQERRTALISAAVTGKIDVREFATEAAA